MSTDRTTSPRVVAYARRDDHILTADFHAAVGADGSAPLMIAVHGGAWQRGSRATYAHIAPRLAESGFSVLAISYRLTTADTNLFPAALADVRSAIRYARTASGELGIDPDRVGIIGDSAGAHLALLATLSGETPGFDPDEATGGPSCAVKVAVGIYGIYDLVAQWQYDQAYRPRPSSSEILLGKSLVDDRRLYQIASPLSYATTGARKTSFLLAWGTEDDIVEPRRQSIALVDALKQADCYVRTVAVPGAPHFWLSEPLEIEASRSAFFLPRLLHFLRDRL